MISLIAAMDEDRGIGKDNQLLCHLPADLKHFKAITLGKPVIMGRKTFESIGRPLPDRQNIVLTRTKKLIAGVDTVSSLDMALQSTHNAAEIMIIGGAELFKEALPMAQRIYLTIIHHQFTADVFFPQLDNKSWQHQITGEKKRDLKNPYNMTFYQYDRIV